jgi:hypothetical protein
MARRIQKNVLTYTEQYVSGLSILELSKKENCPSYLMSRCIVEQITDLPDGKKGLTRSMRDPIGVLGSADAVLSDYLESERHRPDSMGVMGCVQGKIEDLCGDILSQFL